MVAVGDERRLFSLRPARRRTLSRQLVAEEPDHACRRQRTEVVQLLRVDEAVDRLVETPRTR
jgi:hypothetical protein